MNNEINFTDISTLAKLRQFFWSSFQGKYSDTKVLIQRKFESVYNGVLVFSVLRWL